ncbi:MAG: hypothetical protein Q8L48_25545 [Archangium sp.]|nr:hypothetical protein [Archangium sp.]
MSSSAPDAIEPIYTCAVDAPVQLFSGDATLTANGHSQQAHCVIRFSWSPNEGPEVEIQAQSLGLSAATTLTVPSLGLTAPVLGRRASFGTHAPSFLGLLNGSVRFGDPSALSRLVFHIANFPSVYGELVRRSSNLMRARVGLEAPPWVVTIDPVADEGDQHSSDLPTRISEVRGHAITHVGVLNRIDGQPFRAEDADEVLRDVGRTLSLARAAFSMPMLRVGFNAAHARVWECWTGFRTDAWRSHENWFAPLEPGILQSVFAGWRRQSNNSTNEVLDAAFHLYIDSHVPGLAAESRLVLAQSALEGLADGWPHPPRPGSLALPTFGSGAAARVAALSLSLGLPLSVPAGLANLAALTQPTLASPALDKVAWVRNSIAHLGLLPRLTGHPSRIRYEAKQFATQHLELALLRMLDADGMFIDRLGPSGQPRRLPWL